MGSRLALWRSNARPGVRGSLYYLCFWSSVGMYVPFINVYFTNLGLSGQQIAMFGAISPLAVLLFNPLVGATADRRGWHVQLLLSMLAFTALSQIALAFPTSFFTILPVMVMLAVARGPIAPLADSMIAGMAVRHQLAYGKLRLWGSVGYAVTSLLGGIWWAKTGYPTMFILTGCMTGLVAIVANSLDHTPELRKTTVKPAKAPRDAAFIAIVIITGLVGAAFSMVSMFDGNLIQKLSGGSTMMLGILPCVIASTEVPVMLKADRVIARFGTAKTLAIATLILGLGFIGSGMVSEAWMLIPIGMFRACGFGLYSVAIIRLITERIPTNLLATAQGLISAIGGGLSPLLATQAGGYMFDVSGPQLVFIVAGTCIGLATLVVGLGLKLNWFKPATTMNA
ncbi:MFS transporter [Herpetosiphon llansteffanensis]|uniref:MFS transporter n=1 Tax=Herpetosiphon llansteffanensis TaxID=2094568 RepID=UPI0013DEA3AF|nr:MFS transporter [Herpetosiphon llansteffanensis]